MVLGQHRAQAHAVTGALRWQTATFRALTGRALYEVLALRQAVFVVEQDCAYLDADGQDEGALHLLGTDGGVLVAYLRILPPGEGRADAAIGRVITAASHRGLGLGRALMVQGLTEARRVHGDVPVFVSAQAHLAPFYASLGFVRCGEGYDEDGIPHLPMRRT